MGTLLRQAKPEQIVRHGEALGAQLCRYVSPPDGFPCVSKLIGPAGRVRRINTPARSDREVAVANVNFEVAVGGSFDAHDLSVSVADGPADGFARHGTLLLQSRARKIPADLTRGRYTAPCNGLDHRLYGH